MLRQTDGERFVSEINIFNFVRNSQGGIHHLFQNRSVAALEIIRCVIIYPLVRELFAFAIGEQRVENEIRFTRVHLGPPHQLKSSCKNSVDDYNATPPLEGNDCQKKC